ncbi:MAG TPA: ATP-binding cassette domain-containing protein, partial [Streptosporangiaceae bacterium]
MIEVDQLVKRFGVVTAVDGLSFTVRPGHVTGFLGPNGAGKTTTMRVILGLDAPTSGNATIDRQSYTGLVRPLHQVGALLDATALHPGRTATAHLASIAQSNGIGRGRVAEMLQLTGLESVANRRLKGFSLGMKQRLGIAVALLGDPPVLMFDEPVNGLDTEGIAWIRQFMRALAADGRTVLVSSHLMSEMAQTADHLVIIGRGRLLADVPTAELIESSARRDVLVR